jgi:hypothetical protein
MGDCHDLVCVSDQWMSANRVALVVDNCIQSKSGRNMQCNANIQLYWLLHFAGVILGGVLALQTQADGQSVAGMHV